MCAMYRGTCHARLMEAGGQCWVSPLSPSTSSLGRGLFTEPRAGQADELMSSGVAVSAFSTRDRVPGNLNSSPQLWRQALYPPSYLLRHFKESTVFCLDVCGHARVWCAHGCVHMQAEARSHPQVASSSVTCQRVSLLFA